LGSATPVEVLYEAEEPVVFTLATSLGERVLAYLADATPDMRWLLLTPCGDRLLDDLKGGRVALRTALQKSWLWLAKLDNDDTWRAAWAVEISELPAQHLPQSGVMLLPEHEPVLSMRAVGERLGHASTPASVVAYVADATRKALKGVVEHVLEYDRQGRPSDVLRSFYDLPVHHFEFASFQISFAPPTELADDAPLRRGVELLRKGIRWAASDDEQPLMAKTKEEREAILRAIRQLTPPSTGAIERIDVGGRWMGHQAVRLRRSARRRVQTELRRTRAEKTMSATGRLREFDKDNLAFILRQTTSGIDVRATFDEELFDELLEFFTNDDLVCVMGIERAGKLRVAAVSAVPDQDVEEPSET
jgi:hypothetical protein